MTRAELPDFTGHRIHETFFVISKLGQGSFGAVYKAKLDGPPRARPDGYAMIDNREMYDRLAKNRFYALKILPKATYESNKRKLGEYEHVLHARCLGVRGVLRLHATFPMRHEGNEYFCLVLDYVEGGSLLDLINEKAVLYRNNELVREIFAQVVSAVRGCHEQGVYHRDLKPDNVLVSKDYKRAYIADFGLATDEKKNKNFGTGSKLYMSPGKKKGSFFFLHSFLISCGFRMLWNPGVPGLQTRVRAWSHPTDTAHDMLRHQSGQRDVRHGTKRRLEPGYHPPRHGYRYHPLVPRRSTNRCVRFELPPHIDLFTIMVPTLGRPRSTSYARS
jgi:serine/threonine protein kinase